MSLDNIIVKQKTFLSDSVILSPGHAFDPNSVRDCVAIRFMSQQEARKNKQEVLTHCGPSLWTKYSIYVCLTKKIKKTTGSWAHPGRQNVRVTGMPSPQETGLGERAFELDTTSTTR